MDKQQLWKAFEVGKVEEVRELLQTQKLTLIGKMSLNI